MSDSQLKPEIEALREILASLRALLETSEEFRALRQLDERERSGNPLQSIDGLLFRGRLVHRLEESNRTWRAYVLIEKAVAHLEDIDKPEPNLVGERDTARPIPVATVVPPAVRASVAATGAVSPPASQHGTIAAASATSGAKLNGQAAPAARESPPSQSADRTFGGEQKNTLARTGRETGIPITPATPVASSPAASQSKPFEPHRTVLDRIRLVPSAGGKADAPTDSAAGVRDAIGSGRFTDPLPPAIDETSAAKSSNPPNDAVIRDAGIEIPTPSTPSVALNAQSAQAAAQPPVGATVNALQDNTSRAETATGALAPTKSSRLDELESELARLIQHDGAARFPGRVTETAEQEASEPQITSLEPDIRADFGPDADVEEAEVTIIRLAEPARDGAIKPSLPAAAPAAKLQAGITGKPHADAANTSSALTRLRPSGLSPRPSKLAAEAAAANDANTATPADSETDALAADVEEADVEIVVPSRGTGTSGGPGSASRRDTD